MSTYQDRTSAWESSNWSTAQVLLVLYAIPGIKSFKKNPAALLYTAGFFSISLTIFSASSPRTIASMARRTNWHHPSVAIWLRTWRAKLTCQSDSSLVTSNYRPEGKRDSGDAAAYCSRSSERFEYGDRPLATVTDESDATLPWSSSSGD